MTCKYQDDKQHIAEVISSPLVLLNSGYFQLMWCLCGEVMQKFCAAGTNFGPASCQALLLKSPTYPGNHHLETLDIEKCSGCLLYRPSWHSYSGLYTNCSTLESRVEILAFVGSEILCWRNLVSASDPPCLVSNMCSLKQWTPFFPVASVAIPGVIVTCFHMRGR